mmetsp:Transcript_79119/g.237058  ORF Transcript_79119/g.237058 Transcript_79119/m.237058 type:complete len:124 (+) Transcript_79119:150-521(+)|eukprot:5867693-Prymnesium_polylepis.1
MAATLLLATCLALVLAIVLFRWLKERQRRSMEYARVALYESAERPFDQFSYCGTELFPEPPAAAAAVAGDWAPSEPPRTPAPPHTQYRDAETAARTTCGSVGSIVAADDVEAVQRRIRAELGQ